MGTAVTTPEPISSSCRTTVRLPMPLSPIRQHSTNTMATGTIMMISMVVLTMESIVRLFLMAA